MVDKKPKIFDHFDHSKALGRQNYRPIGLFLPLHRKIAL